MKKAKASKNKFAAGDEVVTYLRHSVAGLVPLKVKVKKVVGGVFGQVGYQVETNAGGVFTTRTVKKVKTN